MQGTIHYKPSVGRKRFDAARKELKFSTSEDFLDFCVQIATLAHANHKANKLILQLANSLSRITPLKFTKPTVQEDKEIRQRYAEMKKGKAFVMHPIK